MYFNPRSPSGLRQVHLVQKLFSNHISIHAARVGCDHILIPPRITKCDFNPRSPSGLRQLLLTLGIEIADFNPRSPSGLRQKASALLCSALPISIHAARVGCDFYQYLCLL